MSTTSEPPPPEPMLAAEAEPDSRVAGSRPGWWKIHVLLLGIGLLVLASVLIPPVGGVRSSAAMTVASMNAANIFKALTMYARDHEGKFPEGLHSSNEAFRQFFTEGYIETESPFHVPGSAWHSGSGPDDDIGASPGFAKCLEAGENHWAYLSGLTTDHSPKTPIVMDGFVPGTTGIYTDRPGEKGGVWKGQKAIVVYLDGSAKQEKLDPATLRISVTKGGSLYDPLAKENLPSGTTLLNPE